MKNEKGITIIALVITIVIMVIIASIGIGNLTGERNNINIASKQVLMYELTEVQQSVLQTYLTYKQTQGQTNFYGTKITEWQTARNYLEIIVPALPFKASFKWSISVMMPLPPCSANFAAASTFGNIEPALKYPYFLRPLSSFIEIVPNFSWFSRP